MSHLQQILRCKSESGAQKSAKKIADNLEYYSNAQYGLMTFSEILPKRINRHDPIEDSGIGRSFRKDYARYLVRAWVRNNRKTIIESAYSVAIRKIKSELHISTSAAKNVLLNRVHSDFYEYQE